MFFLFKTNKGVGLSFAPLHFTFFFSTPEVINKATILEPGGEAHTQTHGSEQMQWRQQRKKAGSFLDDILVNPHHLSNCLSPEPLLCEKQKPLTFLTIATPSTHMRARVHTHTYTHPKIKRNFNLQTERHTISNKKVIRTTTIKIYSGEVIKFQGWRIKYKVSRKNYLNRKIKLGQGWRRIQLMSGFSTVTKVYL